MDRSGPLIRANRRKQQVLLSLLKQAREDAGFSQTGLAEILGRPQSFVSKFESGVRRLDLLELQQVCDALGVPLVNFVRQFDKLTR